MLDHLLRYGSVLDLDAPLGFQRLGGDLRVPLGELLEQLDALLRGLESSRSMLFLAAIHAMHTAAEISTTK